MTLESLTDPITKFVWTNWVKIKKDGKTWTQNKYFEDRKESLKIGWDRNISFWWHDY